MDILEKEIVDEIIFKTDNPRDRLMLELMARGGMRIGEVLKLIPRDVYGRKLIIRDPKSGKEKEFIFIPQKIADRLKIISGKIEYSLKIAFFRYATKLPGQWLKRQEMLLAFI